MYRTTVRSCMHLIVWMDGYTFAAPPVQSTSQSVALYSLQVDEHCLDKLNIVKNGTLLCPLTDLVICSIIVPENGNSPRSDYSSQYRRNRQCPNLSINYSFGTDQAI